MLYAIVILTGDKDNLDIIQRDDSSEVICLGAAKPIEAVRQLLRYCTSKEIHDLRVGDLSAIQRRAASTIGESEPAI